MGEALKPEERKEIMAAFEAMDMAAWSLNHYIEEGKGQQVGGMLVAFARKYGRWPNFPDPALLISVKLLQPLLCHAIARGDK
ncbi:MAG: hypothetical protein HPY52_01415 [Firmicutes bacterium]|nr:hypothetical protein [Bacillota bacterium]